MNLAVIYALPVFLLIGSLPAEQLMDPNESETLVKYLTDSPRKTWIQQGMIRAQHMEYHEFDNSMREATETVYLDDSRIRLEIHLEDGLSIDGLSSSSLLRQFEQDFKLNRDRIAVWDNQKRIQYYQSADYAIVATNEENTTPQTCGPMTAGVIPWGHGDFTFSVIMSQNPTASVFREDGRDKILLQYTSNTISLETLVSFVLDPSKDDAVLSYSIENEEAMLRQTYEDYFQAGDQWVPSRISIEQLDKRSGQPKLISYEDWQIENVETSKPSDDMFSVDFKNGTMVELNAGGDFNTFMYNASDQIDISTILEEKIALLQAQDSETVNCATAAVQHIAKQFSKNILEPELAKLISADTKKTALSDMKQTLEEADLNCMAIETDLETLEKMPDCKKVLYLSLSNHYVVLDHIDQDGIWIIDLTSRKFYVKRNADDFMQEWNDGVALLISDGPITPPPDANFRYLQTDEASAIYGGDSFGKYSCTDIIQGNFHVFCPKSIGGIICPGAYYTFFARKGCIEDNNGGVCVGDKMPSYEYFGCIRDPFKTGDDNCVAGASMGTRYIRACE